MKKPDPFIQKESGRDTKRLALFFSNSSQAKFRDELLNFATLNPTSDTFPSKPLDIHKRAGESWCKAYDHLRAVGLPAIIPAEFASILIRHVMKKECSDD